MKFISIFSSQIKALASSEKDEYLALASLENLRGLIPEVDTEKNIDLLPVAFNACVVNRVNKNGDVIDTNTAISIVESFINKQINLEHNREKIIGVILKAGFSEFGTDKILPIEAVKDYKGPFNITLGGLIWKIVNPSLANLIEQSNDPSSEGYQKISASWELGFNDYNIICMEDGQKNIEKATTITNEEEIQKFKSHLKSFGGSGKIDGKNIYRQVKNSVLALGIGLTENPAADVKGILVNEKISDPEIAISSIEEFLEKKEKICVKLDSMKIETLKDINEETWSTLSASSVSEFVSEELRKTSEQFVLESNLVKESLKAATDKASALTADNEALKAKIEEVKSQMDSLLAEKHQADLQEKFNQRFASFDTEFELDEEDRAIIASDIKDLSEEGFATYHKKMSKLMFLKKKKAKSDPEMKDQAKELTEKQKNLPDFIKKKIQEASEASVVEDAIDGAELQKENLPNNSQVNESLNDKYKRAFSIENFEIKI